jgi:hypothetical protein
MLKVHLVYFSQMDACEGLGGGGSWKKPELVAAFKSPTKARN